MARSIRLSPGFVLLVLCFIGTMIAILPPPEGVDPRAFPIFGIFIALIVGILLKPYPILVMTLFGFFVCLITGLLSPKEAFSCFGDGVIWLVVLASIAAKAFVKTNLGRRMACFFIEKTGHSSLSLAYGLTFSELILAPMIPSNTARASCVAIPLTVSISNSLGSNPEKHTTKTIGQYLTLVSMHANQLVCALFLTSMASNPMLQDIMASLGVQVSWTDWWILACVPGLLCMFAMPLLLYKLAPPELTDLPQAKAIARQQLDAMPPMSRQEGIALLVFLGMLVFWIMGGVLHIRPSIVALGGLCTLLLTGVLDADDVTGAKDIWDIFIWLSILNVMAGKLTDYGFIHHYSALLHHNLSGFAWPIVLGIVSLIYYFSRYIIPSNILQACAVFPAFAQVLMACGVPAKIGCMTLALITAFCGFVTPYATSPCPLYYNTGYISQKLWWRMGFQTGGVYLAIWALSGALWWKVLRCW